MILCVCYQGLSKKISKNTFSQHYDNMTIHTHRMLHPVLARIKINARIGIFFMDGTPLEVLMLRKGGWGSGGGGVFSPGSLNANFNLKKNIHTHTDIRGC